MALFVTQRAKLTSSILSTKVLRTEEVRSAGSRAGGLILLLLQLLHVLNKNFLDKCSANELCCDTVRNRYMNSKDSELLESLSKIPRVNLNKGCPFDWLIQQPSYQL